MARSLICVQECSLRSACCFYEDFFPACILFFNVRALVLLQARHSGLLYMDRTTSRESRMVTDARATRPTNPQQGACPPGQAVDAQQCSLRPPFVFPPRPDSLEVCVTFCLSAGTWSRSRSARCDAGNGEVTR